MTVPIGTMLPYGGDTSNGRIIASLFNQGWLVCDGTSVDRREYPELFEVIGTAFGSLDSMYFNLPDLRGRLVRGVDKGIGRDPDAKSRISSAPGGYSGDLVGSVQEDAMQAHKHDDRGHRHPDPGRHCLSGGGHKPAGSEYTSFRNSNPEIENQGKANLGEPTKVDDKYGEPRYSSETRPKNIYVNWIIKAKNVPE